MSASQMYLFLAAFLGLLCLVFFVLGLIQLRAAARHEKHKRLSRAIVCGYDGASSVWTTLMVKLPDLDNGSTYSVKSRKISPADYPKGKEIQVWRVDGRALGSPMPELWLPEAPPPDRRKVGTGFFLAAGLMLIAAVILAITMKV